MPVARARCERRRRRVEVWRNARVFARQVGADRRPVIAAVLGSIELLVRKVEHARIAVRKSEWECPRGARLLEVCNHRIDRACLVRLQVEAVDASAIDDVRVFRVRREVVALAAGGRLAEVGQVDAVVAVRVARNAGRARILLRSVDPVRIPAVGDHVVELRGRLVVPRTPRAASVERHDGALVGAEYHAVGARGVDPQLVVVVAAGRALDGFPRHSGVAGAIQVDVCGPHETGVERTDGDAAEVPAAAPHPSVVAHMRPRRPGVVGAVDAASRRVDDRVDTIRHRRRDRDTDPSRFVGQPVAAKLRPRVAAVRRLVEPGAGSVRRRIDAPRRAARLPQRRVDDLGVAGLEREIHRTCVLVLAEDLLPRVAAVLRAIHAAFGVRSVRMAERGDKQQIGIVRIDDDARDLLRVAQPDVRPGLPCVVGLVHAVALRDVAAHVGFAGADVEDVRPRRRHGDRTDRADGLSVKDGLPRASRVECAPDSAVDRAEEKLVRLVRDAGDGEDAAGAERADAAPVQVREERGIDGGACRRGDGEQQQRNGERANEHGFLRVSGDAGGMYTSRR